MEFYSKKITRFSAEVDQLFSIKFEGVAFELLFGLGQNRLNISTDRAESEKCPTNTL